MNAMDLAGGLVFGAIACAALGLSYLIAKFVAFCARLRISYDPI